MDGEQHLDCGGQRHFLDDSQRNAVLPSAESSVSPASNQRDQVHVQRERRYYQNISKVHMVYHGEHCQLGSFNGQGIERGPFSVNKKAPERDMTAASRSLAN